jgi:hypothetical protein
MTAVCNTILIELSKILFSDSMCIAMKNFSCKLNLVFEAEYISLLLSSNVNFFQSTICFIIYFCYNAHILHDIADYIILISSNKAIKLQRKAVYPGGQPSKHWPLPRLLNFIGSNDNKKHSSGAVVLHIIYRVYLKCVW